jgi:hypothetical protein
MRRPILLCLLACVGCLRTNSNSERHTFEGPFAQVVVNSRHTCLLETDGDVRCFGGDDTRKPPMTPVPATKFVRLASARGTVCGIREDDHAIECFGACINASDCEPAPGAFDGLALHDDRGGCAWNSEHTRCWGDEAFLRFIAPPPQLLTRPVRNIAFGADWSLIHYADGTITPHSRGKTSDDRGVWNDPMLIDIAKRAEVVAEIAGKGATGCVIDVAGAPRCAAYYGGHAPPEVSRAIAIEMSAPMGTMPACVLTTDSPGDRSGSIRCTANVLRSVLQLPGSNYTQIAAGDHHVCGLDESGDVDCIGSDRTGAVTGRRPWP